MAPSMKIPNGRAACALQAREAWDFCIRAASGGGRRSLWLHGGHNQEACLRAHESGLEGVSIHGEVTGRHIPYALNYLAFAHFIHHPQDSLRDFGRHTLGQVFGSEKAGEDYVEILAAMEAGDASEQMQKTAASAARGFGSTAAAGQCENLRQYQRCRFWEWLHAALTRPAAKALETGMAV